MMGSLTFDVVTIIDKTRSYVVDLHHEVVQKYFTITIFAFVSRLRHLFAVRKSVTSSD